jgi:uridine kinase
MKRRYLLKKVARHIASINLPHPVRVAIDGIDAAGKTIFADELVPLLKLYNRPVIRASIDGFHNNRKTRYRRGKESPDGYYRDSFNNNMLITNLLKPLGPNGNLKYKSVGFDFRRDHPVEGDYTRSEPDAILLFDGIFLMRKELSDYWDFRIFLEIDFEVCLARALVRDRYLFGDAKQVKQRYLKKYIPAQKIYLKDRCPVKNAHLVIDNNDPLNISLIKGSMRLG